MDNKQIKWQLAAYSHKGMLRNNNEDAYAVLQDKTVGAYTGEENEEADAAPVFFDGDSDAPALLVVADGMGGTNAGEVASRLAVNVICQGFMPLSKQQELISNPEKSLKDALLFANEEIIEHAQRHPESRGMGTTCVVAYIHNMTAHISWVGDSRAYYFTKKTGLRQLSKDHSFVQDLVDSNQITLEEAFYHPDSNVITQSLGESERKPVPDYMKAPLEEGGLLLLCSDGLNCMLQDHEIDAVLRECDGLNLDQVSQKLVESANEEGGMDNITVALYALENQEQTSDNPLPSWTPALSKMDEDAQNEKVVQARRTTVTKSILWLTLICLVGISGYFWWQQREAERTKEIAAKLELFRKDSLVQDSIKKIAIQALTDTSTHADTSKYSAVVSLNPRQKTDTLSLKPIKLRITKNSKKPRALSLVRKLKDKGYDALCDCDVKPFVVWVNFNSEKEAEDFKSGFSRKYQKILDDFKLVPENFSPEK